MCHLFLVSSACFDTDPMKIIDESNEQCGFEAYRLLGRACDLLNAYTKHVLLSHILALSSLPFAGLAQIESLMREAELRIVTYEKRMNKDGSNPIEAGMMRTICTILYNKFDIQLKKDVDREPPTPLRDADGQILTDNDGQPRIIACQVDSEKMKKIVERQRQMESANKASPMDLSSLEHHDYAAFVAWSEHGAPKAWWPEQES